MEQEIWRPIANSKHYAVSSQGRVKRLQHQKWCKVNNSYSTFKERILTPSFNNSKHYGRICVVINDIKVHCSVHRLVAQTFIPNPANLPQINHKDGIKENNFVSNLEWCTGHQNMQHRIHVLGILGGAKGEACSFCKLTEAQVKSVPALLAKGMKKNAIAKLLKVVPSTITELTSGRSWRHLKLYELKKDIVQTSE
jgi:hypothetical protein